MTKNIKFLGICLLLGSMTISSVFADNSRWWLNLGMGVGVFVFNDGSNYSNLRDSGPAAELSFNYMVRDRQLLTVRGTGIVGLSSALGSAIACSLLSPLTTACDVSAASVTDAGILYGYIYKRPLGYFSTSAGLSVVRANPPSITILGFSSNASPRYTVGIPFELQAFWTPTRYFGLGLIGFADANFNYSNVGALFAIQAGHLNL